MNIYQTRVFAQRFGLTEIPVHNQSVRPPYHLCIVESQFRPQPGVVHIVLVENKTAHPTLEQNAIVCYSISDVERFVSAPSSRQDKSYRIDGFKGMHKFELHLAWKGAKFQPTARNVDWHKLDARDVQRCDSYQVKSRVKSCLDHKSSLPHLGKRELWKLSSEFVPRIWDIETFPFEKGVYIAKPIGRASSGDGISVFDSEKGLQAAKTTIFGKWKAGLVSEYIQNPLLYQGKKFHLRVYLFVSTTGHFSVCREAKMITAKLPYQAALYDNKDIHDTHLCRTDRNLFFSTDFPGQKDCVWPQVERICECVAKTPFRGYPEAEICYDVLGLDILVDRNEKCWLLEVNFTPSLDPVTYDDYGDFSRLYTGWELENVEKLL